MRAGRMPEPMPDALDAASRLPADARPHPASAWSWSGGARGRGTGRAPWTGTNSLPVGRVTRKARGAGADHARSRPHSVWMPGLRAWGGPAWPGSSPAGATPPSPSTALHGAASHHPPAEPHGAEGFTTTSLARAGLSLSPPSSPASLPFVHGTLPIFLARQMGDNSENSEDSEVARRRRNRNSPAANPAIGCRHSRHSAHSGQPRLTVPPRPAASTNATAACYRAGRPSPVPHWPSAPPAIATSPRHSPDTGRRSARTRCRYAAPAPSV